MSLHADSAARLQTYQRLAARNRIVAILRIGVPLLGLIILVALVGQIYVSSLGTRFNVGRVAVSGEAISVDAPQYSGVMSDGTSYRVGAAAAQALAGSTHLITLTDASLAMTRPDARALDVTAPQAVLDTMLQTVTIAGIAYVSDSTGTSGTVNNSVFDYANQQLDGQGPVAIDYADGTRLEAAGLQYDLQSAGWTFTRADVTLPQTPGPQENAQVR